MLIKNTHKKLSHGKIYHFQSRLVCNTNIWQPLRCFQPCYNFKERLKREVVYHLYNLVKSPPSRIVCMFMAGNVADKHNKTKSDFEYKEGKEKIL